jgi:hypothetical protein
MRIRDRKKNTIPTFTWFEPPISIWFQLTYQCYRLRLFWESAETNCTQNLPFRSETPWDGVSNTILFCMRTNASNITKLDSCVLWEYLLITLQICHFQELQNNETKSYRITRTPGRCSLLIWFCAYHELYNLQQSFVVLTLFLLCQFYLLLRKIEYSNGFH